MELKTTNNKLEMHIMLKRKNKTHTKYYKLENKDEILRVCKILQRTFENKTS